MGTAGRPEERRFAPTSLSDRAWSMSELLPFFQHLSVVAREVTLGAPVPGADNKAGEGGFDPVTELDRGAEEPVDVFVNVQASPLQDEVNDADGGWFGGGDLGSFVAEVKR